MFTKWTVNQTYASVSPASTSGTGTGLNVSITVNAAGNPTVALLDTGAGYQVGDTVTFDPPDKVGDPVTVTITGTADVQVPASSPGYKVGDTVTFYPPDNVGDPLTVTITGDAYTQELNDNWTPNMNYTGVAVTATTGTGTGMSGNIVTDDLGVPSLTLDSFGTGYQVGDSVTFNEPNTGAQPISAIVDSIGTVTQLPGAFWTAGQTYNNVSPSATSGSGTGMVVNISVDSTGEPLATLVSAGTGYANGDTVTFAPPDGVGDPLMVQVEDLMSGRARAVISTVNPTGDSGAINFMAPEITIGPGTQLLATATTGHHAGDIFFSANSDLSLSYDPTSVATSIFDPLKSHQTAASIQVTGATVAGGNVEMYSDASTDRFAGYDVFSDGLASYVAGQNVGNLSNPTETTITFADRTGTTAATITRSQGSWISDGFQVGQQIITVGTAHNDNATYTIAGISPLVITLVPDDFLTPETDDGTVDVKQLLSSVLPQNLPVNSVDANGNPTNTSVPVSQLVRPLDCATGLYQQINLYGFFPVFEGVTSKATTAIQILSTTSITATGNVDIETSSISDAVVSTPSLVLGAAYANSDGYATTTIGSGVQIKAGGNFTLKSLVTNTMEAEVQITAGLVEPIPTLLGNSKNPAQTVALKIPGPAISVAYGVAVSASTTTLASGASVMAAGVTIDSQNNNSFQVLTDSTVIRRGFTIPTRRRGTPRTKGAALRSPSATFPRRARHRGGRTNHRDGQRRGDVRVAQQRQQHDLRNGGTQQAGHGRLWRGPVQEDGIDSTRRPTASARRRKARDRGRRVGRHQHQPGRRPHGATGAVSTQGNLTVNAQAGGVFRASAMGCALALRVRHRRHRGVGRHESNQAFSSIDSTVGVNVGQKLSVTSEATIPLVLVPVEQYDKLAEFFTNETSGEARVRTRHDHQCLRPRLDAGRPCRPALPLSLESVPRGRPADVDGPVNDREALESTLDADLNAILTGGVSIYDATRFAGVTLSASTQSLLATNPTGAQLRL